MAGTKRCMRCLIGTYVGGVCSNCHRQETRQQEQDPSLLPEGSVLHGQYFIGEALGHGGFGITYAAWDMKHQRRVAIKELFPSTIVMRNPDRRSISVQFGQKAQFDHMFHCFEQEAMLLMRLQNQNGIVNLYHAFEDNNTAYYVMEYLEGADFRQFLAKNGAISWETLSPMLHTLLGALEKLHTEGLIHRDISPDNIFLTNDGNVHLIDFGSVRAYQGANHFTAYIKHCFAPWEQYRSNGKQGPWTDVYALSVTVYYALSGKLPPDAPQRKLNDTAVPLGQLCPQLPRHVAEAVMWGMAVEPEDRCQSIPELARLLYPDEKKSGAGLSGSLTCCKGRYQGQTWPLAPGQSCRIGRHPDCEINYPPDAQGISRNQCTVYRNNDGQILVRDENSSFGTYLISSQGQLRLAPMQWYLAGGCWLCFGQQEQYWIQ